MKKGWFSIGKSKEKKNKTPKQEKSKDGEKEKRNTLYDLFLKDSKEKKKTVDNDNDTTSKVLNMTEDNGNKNNKNSKNKSQKSKETQQKKTIEQMVEELDEKEFAELITNIKEKFPNLNTSWLFEAAFYLNSKIPSNVKDVLNVFNNTLDYPTNVMKENFKKELIDLFKLFSNEELYQVQMSIIESIIPNIYLTQVSGPVGYLLFLQCLSMYLGQNSTENLERVASPIIRNKYKEKPNLFLTQIWCLQCVGFSNLRAGLEVWKKLYEPQIEQFAHKYFYQFALKYLQQILDYNSNYKDALDIVDVTDLIKILKLKSVSEHQDVLDKVLPKLKLVCLGNLEDKEIASSFKTLISNLNSFKNESQLEEFIISCLVFCLERNKACFDIWLEHHKTLASNKDPLLEYLIANPNNILNQKRPFRSTLYKIAKFNDKQSQSNYQSKDILKTMGNSKSCRCNFVLFLIAAILTYVAYDSRLNGSFERSNTAKYLKRWQLYAYVQPAASSIERNVLSLKKQYDVNYGPTVNSYVGQLLKEYDSNVKPTIDPYLEKVVNISTPLVNSVRENSVIAYRVAEEYYSTYSKQVLDAVNKFASFLEKNVFTGALKIDNLTLAINDSFEKFVHLYTSAWKWAVNKFATLTQ